MVRKMSNQRLTEVFQQAILHVHLPTFNCDFNLGWIEFYQQKKKKKKTLGWIEKTTVFDQQECKSFSLLVFGIMIVILGLICLHGIKCIRIHDQTSLNKAIDSFVFIYKL